MELLALVVGAAIPKGAKKVATTNVSASDGRTVEYEEGAKRNDPLRHYTANMRVSEPSCSLVHFFPGLTGKTCDRNSRLCVNGRARTRT